jgi:RNA polymerase sigma-70 factor (ECF subfamily)
MLHLILAISDPVKQSIVLELYEGYRDQALGIAYSIVRNRAAAEDIVQEAMARLIKNVDKLVYGTAKDNWPYYVTIIKNLSKNYMRENSRLLLVDDYSAVEPDMLRKTENVDIGELIATNEQFDMAIIEINKLPEIYKDAVMLRYRYELTNKEISKLLGISMGNVRTRVHRGFKMLEKRWQGGKGNGR